MADKNFFDLLREKMAALRPSSKHQAKDWAKLTGQLDQAMPPHQVPARQRTWLPLLLLLLALLASNVLWWQSNRESQTAMQRLEVQMAGLQSTMSAIKPVPPVLRIDTVWRTVYIQAPAPSREQFTASADQQYKAGSSDTKPVFDQKLADGNDVLNTPKDQRDLRQQNETIAVSVSNKLNTDVRQEKALTLGEEAFSIVQMLPPVPLTQSVHSNRQAAFSPGDFLQPTPEPRKPTRPLGPLLLDAVKPKYFKIGALVSWTQPLSPALIHEVGFEAGVQGAIGFSRHWSLILEYSLGKLHYEANKPTAILGTPEFPALSSSEYHYAHLDLQKQTFRQFGIGLRYTFSEWAKMRPYVGLNWGNQTVLPFQVKYEVQHEPSSTIQQGSLSITQNTPLRNYLRLSAGLEIPLSTRFDLTVEGFYQRQVKKKHVDALDLMGLRAGINFNF